MRYALWVCFILALIYGGKVVLETAQERVLAAQLLDEQRNSNLNVQIRGLKECLRTGESVHECLMLTKEKE